MSTCIQPPALLLRTPLAAQALAGRAAFTLRQRSILMMAEAAPRAQLDRLFHGQGAAMVQELLDAGYLAPARTDGNATETCRDALPVARLRAQLLELCERLLHEQDGNLGEHLRHLLLTAPDRASLRTACDAWMQALVQQGGARRIGCLRRQLAQLMGTERNDKAGARAEGSDLPLEADAG